MGESNALAMKRGTPLRRDTALAAAAAYQELYCEGTEEGDTNDSMAATYQVRSGRELSEPWGDCQLKVARNGQGL